MMLICIKQHLTTFEAQFMKKLSNTEAELKKKTLLIKKNKQHLKLNSWKSLSNTEAELKKRRCS